MTIGVVGLGLMGGSLAQAARAAKTAPPHRVLGADRDPQTLSQALEDGTLDGVLDRESLGTCDLVILALYPQAAVEYLTREAASLKKGAWVVDFCGVKRPVCEALEPLSLAHGFHFVGGHPMAGRERSGYGAATPGLFGGASMVLTPHDDTPGQVLGGLEEFFLSLGFGRILCTDPATHDRMIAYTSQLAHVLSNAYIKSPASLTHKGFSAGSFQDLTRVARLNPAMWTQLFLDNRDFLVQEIDQLCQRLTAYGDALEAGDGEELFRLLQEGNDWKIRSEDL